MTNLHGTAVLEQPEAGGPMALQPNTALELIEAYGIGTWVLQVEGNQLNWSAGVSRILGLPHDPESQSIEAFVELIHPADRSAFMQISIAASGGGTDEREFRVLRRNGEMRWVKSFGKLVYSRDGRPEKLLGTLFDISEIRLAFEALDQREGVYEALRQLLDVVVWSVDGDGQVRDELGWWRDTQQRGRVDGWNRLEAVHPEDRDRVRAAWAEALRSRHPYIASYRVLWGSDYVPVVSRAVAVIDKQGGMRRWVGVTVRQDAQLRLAFDMPQAEPAPLTPGQVRAARGYLGWSAEQLADEAGVSFSTVRRVETPGERGVRPQSLSAIRTALERAGIRFAVDRDGATCVSLVAKG